MAFGNWRDCLRGREEVSLKKYLYVFRPPFGGLRALSLSKRLLACRWIERQLGQVPMLFAQLVESVLEEADVRAALDEIVARKQAGEELAVAPPVEVFSRFVDAELPRLEALNGPDDAAGDVEELASSAATRSQLERRKSPAGACNPAAPTGNLLRIPREERPGSLPLLRALERLLAVEQRADVADVFAAFREALALVHREHLVALADGVRPVAARH
jgi:RNA repair pathway DNA polymerase beta family